MRLIISTLALFALAAVSATDSLAQTLRGSPASVERIYQQALGHDLHFYETGAGVYRAVERGTLVRLDGNENYRTHNVSYPFALPVAEVFVNRLAAQYRAACGEQMVVTSAIRPRSFRLANSVSRSVHPTGMAIDLRRPTDPTCLRWLRETLLSLERTGVIEVVEERRPPHFHVAIFPRPYLQYVQRRTGGPVLASAVPVTPTEVRDASSYVVRRGDTLWSIARRHETTVEDIKSANRLATPNIQAGQTLLIPAR